MAGVYIKGMVKPKECRDCPFNIGVCIAKVAVFEKEPLHDPGEEWCPIEAVPNHGDLIEAHSLKIRLGQRFSLDERRVMEIVRETVDTANVVIPADKDWV